MKIALTIIFLVLSFNSFSHNEDFNEKEKKLENELRNDKNWPPLIALYNLHGFTEDFGCHNVLPYAKIIKKAGWCLDYDFKKYRDKAFKKQIIETYGESAKKNFKDYYFQFESTTYPKNHKAYYPKSHITCSERFKEEFNGNLNKFLNHKDGLYKNVCPRFIKYQKRLDSGDEKLLTEIENDRKLFDRFSSSPIVFLQAWNLHNSYMENVLPNFVNEALFGMQLRRRFSQESASLSTTSTSSDPFAKEFFDSRQKDCQDELQHLWKKYDEAVLDSDRKRILSDIGAHVQKISQSEMQVQQDADKKKGPLGPPTAAYSEAALQAIQDVEDNLADETFNPFRVRPLDNLLPPMAITDKPTSS